MKSFIGHAIPRETSWINHGYPYPLFHETRVSLLLHWWKRGTPYPLDETVVPLYPPCLMKQATHPWMSRGYPNPLFNVTRYPYPLGWDSYLPLWMKQGCPPNTRWINHKHQIACSSVCVEAEAFQNCTKGTAFHSSFSLMVG